MTDSTCYISTKESDIAFNRSTGLGLQTRPHYLSRQTSSVHNSLENKLSVCSTIGNIVCDHICSAVLAFAINVELLPFLAIGVVDAKVYVRSYPYPWTIAGKENSRVGTVSSMCNLPAHRVVKGRADFLGDFAARI